MVILLSGDIHPILGKAINDADIDYAVIGNEMRKIVPLAGAFSAVMLPPCASTRCLAIARPRPIPPESVDL